MFRVLCFVEDKDLGKVKRALAEAGAKKVDDRPVVNVEEAPNGELKAKVNGGLTERVYQDIVATKPAITKIKRGDLLNFITKQGGSAGSLQTITTRLCTAKYLKRSKQRGYYDVRRA